MNTMNPADAPEARQHVTHTPATTSKNRPPFIPLLTPEDFCKARYSHNDNRCYTARMLDTFLDPRHPFVEAYREFRLKTMDYLYEHHRDDHAKDAVSRCKGWNAVAKSLDYDQVPISEYKAWLEAIIKKAPEIAEEPPV